MQSNGYDCGVQVLANALYHMGGIEAPLAHDCGLWSRICRAIISHSVDEVSDKPLDNINYSAELIWKKARLESPETRHQAVEKAFDMLQSERKRNRSEVEEVLGIEQLLKSLFIPRPRQVNFRGLSITVQKWGKHGGPERRTDHGYRKLKNGDWKRRR